MNKKILGIVAAIAVVVIIVLVSMNKPANNADRETLKRQIEQNQAVEQVPAAIDSLGVDSLHSVQP